jgi:hypothetical protein
MRPIGMSKSPSDRFGLDDLGKRSTAVPGCRTAAIAIFLKNLRFLLDFRAAMKFKGIVGLY